MKTDQSNFGRKNMEIDGGNVDHTHPLGSYFAKDGYISRKYKPDERRSELAVKKLVLKNSMLSIVRGVIPRGLFSNGSIEL